MAGFVQVDTSLHFMACYIKHHTSCLLESSDIISQVSQPRYRVHLFSETNKQTFIRSKTIYLSISKQFI